MPDTCTHCMPERYTATDRGFMKKNIAPALSLAAFSVGVSRNGFVDLCGTVGRHPDVWYWKSHDQAHPGCKTSPGYYRIPVWYHRCPHCSFSDRENKWSTYQSGRHNGFLVVPEN